MTNLPLVVLSIISNFSHIFSKPTWDKFQILLLGAIITKGKRTVTSCLRAMGLSQIKRFEKFHRVLNRDKWNEFSLVKALVQLLMKFIPENKHIFIAIDETIERRSGKNIKKKGCYRDACRSSESLVVKCFGLKWLCASIMVKFPWANRSWALPFMTVLCNSKKYDEDNKITHKTSIDKCVNLISIFAMLFKNRKLIILGDGGFANFKIINKCISAGVALIS